MALSMFQPFNPPLGPQPVNNQLYAPQQVTLKMREKIMSLSGDGYIVQTTDGVDVLKCKGKVISAHRKKTFTNMQGAELFTVEKKLFKVSASFEAKSPNGHNFDVTGHWSFGKAKSTVEFRNAADGSVIELDVKGSWFDRKADITLGGRPVAHISRDFFNAREIFGKQTYFVAVAPNVDLSLIAAICVCLDERERENSAIVAGGAGA